ncbi:MAG: hypothetical protein ACFCUJ_12520 [Thiotrichales bacterium]
MWNTPRPRTVLLVTLIAAATLSNARAATGLGIVQWVDDVARCDDTLLQCTTASKTSYQARFYVRVTNHNPIVAEAIAAPFKIEVDLAKAFDDAGMRYRIAEAPRFLAKADSTSNATPPVTTAGGGSADLDSGTPSAAVPVANPEFDGSDTKRLLASGTVAPGEALVATYLLEIDTVGGAGVVKTSATLTSDADIYYSLSGDTDPDVTLNAYIKPGRATALYLPPAIATLAVGQDCPVDTLPSGDNLILNGEFAAVSDAALPFNSTANELIAASFFSDLPLVHHGRDKSLAASSPPGPIVFPAYPPTPTADTPERGGSIALVRHAMLNSDLIQQSPWPDGGVTWLAYAGNTGQPAPQRFWRQSVAVVPGTTYRFRVHLSAAGQPDDTRNTAEHDPIIALQVDGQTIGNTLALAAETGRDVWTRLESRFVPTEARVELAVANMHAGADVHSVVGLTGLSLEACIPRQSGNPVETPVDTPDETAPSNDPGAATDTSPAPRPADATVADDTFVPFSRSVISGGGGGAVGVLGLFAGGLLAWARRRRLN